MNKYRILSPDGFDIEMGRTYRREELDDALDEFKNRFRAKGYYKTSDWREIDVDDIPALCEIVEIN